MKLNLLFVFLIVSMVGIVRAQAPDKFNYQAVVRNTSGSVVQNQSVGVRISITQGSAGGPTVFTETHNPTTNNYGLINLIIGNGTNFGPQLNTIDWAADIYFISVQIDPNGGTSYSITSTTQLISVPYALHAKTVEENDDADANPTNEYNTGASLSGTILQITDGGGTQTVDLSSLEDDADANPTNEIQIISKVGNIITLSNGGGAVTDDVDDADASPSNELNTGITLTGTTLSIIDAGGTQSVSLATLGNDADANPSNEYNTSGNLTGTTLNIVDGGGTISVNLSSLGNDADANPSNEYNTSANLTGTTLNIIDGGGTISVNLSTLGNDADANPSNEYNTGASLSGSTLNITDGGGTISVNLSSLGNDADANPTNEIQTLSLVGSNLSISGGNTITLGSGTDSQTLSLSGADLSISNGNTITLPGGTDSQTLSISGNDISISNGNTITIPADTDDQTLSLVGNNLSIAGGNTVALPADTDDQTLSLSGADLTISDGNTITLPIQSHFVGEHYGGGIVVFVDSTGQHGIICAYADLAGTYKFQDVSSMNLITTNLTDGSVNTPLLVAGVNGPYPAAVAADAYAGGGHTDWYLPSVYELELLLRSNYILGTYALTWGGTNFYWSSTQDPTAAGINAYRCLGGPVSISSYGEANAFKVRCVRKF